MKLTMPEEGPFIVEGPTPLVDPNGRACATKDLTKFALCRCAGSSKKLFWGHARRAHGRAPHPA